MARLAQYRQDVVYQVQKVDKQEQDQVVKYKIMFS